MDDSIFILRTAETWKKHETAANVYLEQITCLFSRSLSGEALDLPGDSLESLVKLSSLDDVEGFSIPTGCIKVISSDAPVIVASPQE